MIMVNNGCECSCNKINLSDEFVNFLDSLETLMTFLVGKCLFGKLENESRRMKIKRNMENVLEIGNTLSVHVQLMSSREAT